MKSNYYDNVIRRLKEACGLETLPEITQLWKDLDSHLELDYADYLKLEEQIKQLSES